MVSAERVWKNGIVSFCGQRMITKVAIDEAKHLVISRVLTP